MINPMAGRVARIAVVQAVTLGMFLAAVVFDEGVRGFAAFMNVEALMMVFGGTFLLSLAHLKAPWRKSIGPALRRARDYAVALGGLTAVCGTILMLCSISDVAQVPRRMALALDGLFFGLLLSEVLLAPYEAVFEDGGGQGNPGRRAWIAGAAGATVLLAMFAILLALSWSLSR